MRSQEERDQQTLDIMVALLTASMLWFLPVVVLAFASHLAGVEGIPTYFVVAAGICFTATVVGTLRRLR